MAPLTGVEHDPRLDYAGRNLRCRPLLGLMDFLYLLWPTAGSPWATGRRRYAALDHAETLKLALMGLRPGLHCFAPSGLGV